MPLAFAAVSRQRIAAGIQPDVGEVPSDGEVCMMVSAAEKQKGVIWPAGGCTIPPDLPLEPEGEETPMPDETGFEIQNPGGDDVTRPITEKERRELAAKLADARDQAVGDFAKGAFAPLAPITDEEVAVKDVVMGGGRMGADERKRWPHLAILEDTMLEAAAHRAKAEVQRAKAQHHGQEPVVRVGRPVLHETSQDHYGLALRKEARLDRATTILAGLYACPEGDPFHGLARTRQVKLAVRLADLLEEEVAR